MSPRHLYLAILLLLALATAALAAEVEGIDLGAEAAALGQPLVADFGMNRCSSCIKQSEAIEVLEGETLGRVGWKFIHIGGDEKTAARYKILLIPTLIFFDEHGVERYRYVGYMDAEAFREKLRELRMLQGT